MSFRFWFVSFMIFPGAHLFLVRDTIFGALVRLYQFRAKHVFISFFLVFVFLFLDFYINIRAKRSGLVFCFEFFLVLWYCSWCIGFFGLTVGLLVFYG